MEDLQKKHRQEQRDLQSRITNKKKNATKKTRKGVNDECDRLERELLDRQAGELASLTGTSNADEDDEENADQADTSTTSDPKQANINDPTSKTVTSNVKDASEPDPNSSPNSTTKKPNRQKARLARRVAAQEAASASAAEEATSQRDLRKEERLAMAAHLTARGLVEHEVRSDGHCMYAAVADQISQAHIIVAERKLVKGENDFKEIRNHAADFMTSHSEEFLPFLEEDLNGYVRKIRETAEWGGHLELSALARSYGVVINVVQGDGRVEKIESQGKVGKVEEIWLAYYRHSFGLGEHYNSLRPAK